MQDRSGKFFSFPFPLPIPSFESAKIHAKVRPRYVVFAILRLSYPLGLPQRPPSVAVMREWQGLHNAMRFSGS